MAPEIAHGSKWYLSKAYQDSAGVINFVDEDRFLSPRSLIAVMESIHWVN